MRNAPCFALFVFLGNDSRLSRRGGYGKDIAGQFCQPASFKYALRMRLTCRGHRCSDSAISSSVSSSA